jgi:hypothetical protein
MQKILFVGTGIFFLLFLVSCSKKVEPNPIWMVTWDARVGEEQHKDLSFPDFMEVETDGDGNVYFYSNFYSFEKPHKKTLIQNSSSIIYPGFVRNYLRKYSSDGKLIWEKIWELGMHFSFGKELAVSGNGNVFLTGVVSNYQDLDPGEGEFKSDIEDRSSYIICLNTNGEFQWGRFLLSEINSIGTDENDSLYYAGTLQPMNSADNNPSQYDLDPGPGEDIHTSISSDDYYVAKLNASGDYQWGKTWTVYGGGSSVSLCVNPNGTAWIACHGSRPVDFQNPTTVARPGPDDQDICLAMFNPSGDLQWVTNWGGKEPYSVSSVIADASGKIYISGTFITPTTGSKEYQLNPYIAKFNAEGKPLWEKKVDGFLGFRRLAIGRNGNVIVPVANKIVSITKPDKFDIGLSAYSQSGNLIKTAELGSNQPYSPIAVAVDLDGYVYVGSIRGEEFFLEKFSPDPNAWGR